MPEPVFEPKKKSIRKPPIEQPGADEKSHLSSPLAGLQQQVGNRAVQRLLQRAGEGPTELDEETTSRIESERSAGKELDPAARESLGTAMGHDFSGVRVHESAESDDLNRQIGAQAFTTGSDIFFSAGAYQPETGAGRELLAHELTHVVQQGSGQVRAEGSGMTVNEPGDPHEQQADAVAASVTSAPVQLQEEEEEMAQLRPLQRQEEEDQLVSSVAEDDWGAAEAGTAEDEELMYVIPENEEPASSVTGGQSVEQAAETPEEELMYVTEGEDEFAVTSTTEEEEEF